MTSASVRFITFILLFTDLIVLKSHPMVFFFFYIYLFPCMCRWGACVAIRGQLSGASPFLPPCSSQKKFRLAVSVGGVLIYSAMLLASQWCFHMNYFQAVCFLCGYWSSPLLKNKLFVIFGNL